MSKTNKIKEVIGRIISKLLSWLDSGECARCKSSSACPTMFGNFQVGTINIEREEEPTNDSDGTRLS